MYFETYSSPSMYLSYKIAVVRNQKIKLTKDNQEILVFKFNQKLKNGCEWTMKWKKTVLVITSTVLDLKFYLGTSGEKKILTQCLSSEVDEHNNLLLL
jgi:hypothetical protein